MILFYTRLLVFLLLIQSTLAQQNDKEPLSHCAHTHDVISKSGDYIKTACYVTSELKYKEAEKYCQTHGGQLYAITSENDWNEINDFMLQIFGRGWGMEVWINGEYSSYGSQWMVTNPNHEPLYEDAIPRYRYSHGAYIQTPFAQGDCLKIDNSVKTLFMTCDHVGFFICEHLTNYQNQI